MGVIQAKKIPPGRDGWGNAVVEKSEMQRFYDYSASN